MRVMPLSKQDPSSFSRPDHHLIEHIHLKWNVDFDKKIFKGSAVLKIKQVDRNQVNLLLDVKDLTISQITLDGKVLEFIINETIENIGSKLTVKIPQIADSYEINIDYETSPEASGLQWLDALQTTGRRHPYLFSQFHAIRARSVVPCQDSPAVKFTYTADVTVPKVLTVLMSALRENKSTSSDGKLATYSFNQPIKISAYLLAIAVGDLESRAVSPRISVWAEKELVDKAAWEFGEAEEMLKMGEEVCGPYVWGVYDILLLPPSFSYGGMENPCITFLTPTLLVGDRSLASIIVHELTHSWTGNLVTNRNFEHFWLNEGFTVFVERKISSRLKGEENGESKHRDLSTLLGLAELRDTTFDILGENNPMTKLVVDLKGLNPDDAFSVVPYEKGSTFLRYLENVIGGPDQFDPFLREYIKHFQQKSIDTNDFKEFFTGYFKGRPELEQIEWNKWFYSPGMPLHIPKYDSTLLEVCNKLVEQWTAPNADYSKFNMSDIKDMDVKQRRQFLHLLYQKNVSLELVKAVETAYEFSTTNNIVIKLKWIRLCIKVRWADKFNDALQFVNEQGRIGYVRPVYRDLYAWEDFRQKTVDNFNKNKKYMMQILTYLLKKDLHIE